MRSLDRHLFATIEAAPLQETVILCISTTGLDDEPSSFPFKPPGCEPKSLQGLLMILEDHLNGLAVDLKGWCVLLVEGERPYPHNHDLTDHRHDKIRYLRRELFNDYRVTEVTNQVSTLFHTVIRLDPQDVLR